ncbi:MAG: hypothetical protein LC623_09000, partial [Halobacteriales archaeon]|nr:hypothetical protein [Halobacteriales archaeon]
MTVTWDSALRGFQLANTASLGQLRLQVTPASDSSPRLLFGMDQAPSGTVSFAQGAGFQSFLATAPSPVGRLWASMDQGGTGAMQALAQPGFFLDASVSGKPFQLNLPGVKLAEGSATFPGAPFARIDTTGGSPISVRMNTPSLQLTATASALGAGLARIEWPDPTSDGARFYVTGLAGSTAHLGAILSQDYAQVDVVGSPSTWSITTKASEFHYTGSSPATSLQSSGLFHGSAYGLRATGVPGQLDGVFGAGLSVGSVSAPGSSVGTITLAWAPGGGLPSIPTGTDSVMVDAGGAGSGLLRLGLSGLKSATWNVPDATQAAGSTLQFHIDQAASSARPAVLQGVQAHHQTRIDLPNGLPAVLDAKLQRDPAQWKLTTTMDFSKTLKVQHQETNGGSLVTQVSAPGALTVAPKANRALEWNGSPASIAVQSRWNQGYVEATLTNGPSRFAIDGNGLKTWSGSMSTLDSGTAGRAKVLLVPDAGQTVNRVSAESDYAAVELMGKGPYAEVNAASFQSFTWMLPNATGQTPAGMTLTRGQALPGKTLVVLSGTREDVTAKITNAAAAVGFTVYQSNNTGASNPRPVQVQYISTGGTTGQLDLTHVASDTGQLLSSYIAGASGTTNLVATGAEPARITITASGNQGGIGFQTTDLGTLLKMDVQGLTSKLVASVTRGTCDTTSAFKGQVSTQGTGSTGPVQVFIGDGGNVPNMRPGQQAVDARCQGATAHVGVQLPTTTDTHWDTNNCNADYSFGANRQRSTYYVETSNGFLDAAAALENQNAGTVAFHFTNSDGVRHGSSDRMSILSEKVTFPTCMQFRDTAKWYTLGGANVARDLHLDMHARSGPLGELPTLTLESPSLEASGAINLDVRVAARYYEQWHKARIQAGSPIGKLDAFIGSTDGEQRRSFGDADGFQFLNDGNINWHMQFQNLRRLEAAADRACQGMKFDVDYNRVSGSRNMVDYINLGSGCDAAKFTVDLPTTFNYVLGWETLTDVVLDIKQTSQTIQEMKLWSDGACVTDSSCIGYGTKLDFELALRGIPAGSTDIRSYIKGATGILHMFPNSGKIDDVR